MFLIAGHSFILHAVTMRTPARAASGICDITGPRMSIEAMSVSEWNTLTSLVFPPDLMATLVRAIAAVAGTPPKKGMSMLPTPCAISSRCASIFSFFILPAEAPQRRLSIMPRAATETAGER